MLAALAAHPGPIHNVTIQDVPEPDAPQGGEVIVRMLASTFNPSDAVTVSGAYASRTEFPLVPGFEGVGVVERIGPEVPSALLGRRLLPIGSAGALQELKRTDHTWCIPVPDDIPTDVACFVYINPLTAYLMVERFCGDARTVLIDGASTTIARHLQELLDQRGIETVMVGRQVEMFRLRDMVHACPRSELPALFEGVFDQLRAGRLCSRVAREVSLRELPEVLKEYRPGEGKLLVRVTD